MQKEFRIKSVSFRKRILEGLFGNQQMNDLKVFNLYIDILLIVYMFWAKIIIFFLRLV